MMDLKAGLTDADLMDKYGLSFQGLQDLFSKLIQAGLATQAYFSRRAMTKVIAPPKDKNEGQETTCPYCGFVADAKFSRCPRCKQDLSEFLDTVELTKILAGSFE